MEHIHIYQNESFVGNMTFIIKISCQRCTILLLYIFLLINALTFCLPDWLS